MRENVASLSKISPRAKIGKNVQIGDFTIIYDNVEIGDNSIIESHCIIGNPSPLAEGAPLIIGASSHIRSHSVFYEGSKFGSELRTGHRVTVREKTEAGKGFQLGTLSDIQGHCKIGDYTRTHSNVHIGQGTKIGSYVWIFPYVVITNDPHPPSEIRLNVLVEDFAVIATMSTILPGVVIGKESLVGAGSIVNKDVIASTIVVGNPAKEVGVTSKIKLKDGSGLSAYPWKKRFFRGYPENVIAQWIEDK